MVKMMVSYADYDHPLFPTSPCPPLKAEDRERWGNRNGIGELSIGLTNGTRALGSNLRQSK
jgi:hypothetical protein